MNGQNAVVEKKGGPGTELLDIELSPKKDTKGTWVFANEDYNMQIYVPKALLAGKCDPANITMRLQLSVAKVR